MFKKFFVGFIAGSIKYPEIGRIYMEILKLLKKDDKDIFTKVEKLIPGDEEHLKLLRLLPFLYNGKKKKFIPHNYHELFKRFKEDYNRITFTRINNKDKWYDFLKIFLKRKLDKELFFKYFFIEQRKEFFEMFDFFLKSVKNCFSGKEIDDLYF